MDLKFAKPEEVFKKSAELSELDQKLLKAVSRKKVSVLEVTELLDKGANVNAADKFGRTALMIVARSCNREILNLLLQLRANPNLQTCYGDTALHIAVRKGLFKSTILLLENGAIYNVKNSAGETPLDIAKEFSVKSFLEGLDKYMREQFNDVVHIGVDYQKFMNQYISSYNCCIVQCWHYCT